MSPLSLTGLACFGAAIAIGLIASGTWRPVAEPVRSQPSARGLAVISMAFCEGGAVLGVVVGLIAATTGLVPDPADGVLAAGPAVAGALVGLGLILAKRRQIDPKVAEPAAAFIVGIAVLGIVVALMARYLHEPDSMSVATGPFALLGLINAASTLAMGVTSSRAVASLEGADASATTSIAKRQVSRNGVFQLGVIGSTVVALLFVVKA
jgi:F0F1-type ATP synthase membrane subunit c/vacuolar-type H+-ATPase subunit K